MNSAAHLGEPTYDRDQNVEDDGPYHGTKKKGEKIIPTSDASALPPLRPSMRWSSQVPWPPSCLSLLASCSRPRALPAPHWLSVIRIHACCCYVKCRRCMGQRQKPKALGYNKSEKEHYDATVVGDTVGDPFKDTSGPALTSSSSYVCYLTCDRACT